jgi:hypothetical protein
MRNPLLGRRKKPSVIVIDWLRRTLMISLFGIGHEIWWLPRKHGRY